jgi:cellulose synthase/poly-beta-1,6-N-acetylglucosamine synthase-like glycosyltransferase
MLAALERADCAPLIAINLGAACACIYWHNGVFDTQKASKNGFAGFFSGFLGVQIAKAVRINSMQFTLSFLEPAGFTSLFDRANYSSQACKSCCLFGGNCCAIPQVLRYGSRWASRCCTYDDA